MYNEISIIEIKENLEKETDFIFKNTDNSEIIDSLERIRQGYFKLYNMLNEKK